MEDRQYLLVLDTKDIAPTSVIDTNRKIEKIGKTQKYTERTTDKTNGSHILTHQEKWIGITSAMNDNISKVMYVQLF